ncbi:MAG: metallophosphoesterase [Nitrososphaeraceae archaeon]
MHSTKFQTGLHFTDIHFGRKSNSPLHNLDCINYIKWVCSISKKEKVEYIAFLGDWNEHRSSLNVATLHESYTAAKLLNDLNIPIYFCIGNHDLYNRHNRDIYSVIPFNEFTNFVVIDNPTIIQDVVDDMLICPYLFHHEYENLINYNNIPFWAGHFEFKGFQITGQGTIMQSGPDHTIFSGPKNIVSGHFHKRQQNGNTTFIGNTFPMDFSDADDNARGCMIYNHVSHTMKFIDWSSCPKYTKTVLTDILDGTAIIHPDSRVKCVIDVPLTFEECMTLRHTFLDQYKLREFSFEESIEIRNAIIENDEIIQIDSNIDNVDDLVVAMLQNIETTHIDNELLISIYQKLGTI